MSGINASLIKQCKVGDERALYQLYRHCYPMMKGICWRYIFDKDSVSGVVNASFLKIVKGLDSYDAQKPFMPWATTIVIRVALDHVRKVMRSTERQTDYVEDIATINGHSSIANLADQQFDAEELYMLLKCLPDRTRVVFNLFAIDGFSHQEISEKLNISTGTSKWHVSKAREQLQRELLNKMNKNKSDYEPSHR